MMEYYCATDIGLVREKNQDSYLAIENANGDSLFLVCDGIGGGKAGEVASSEVVKHMRNAFPDAYKFSSLIDAEEYISRELKYANRLVYDLSCKHEEYEGMGTTVTGLLFTEFGVLSINIGDSRVYGFLDNMYFKLTKDHTLINEMLEAGTITYEESLNHPKKHYLTRALGIYRTTMFDIHKVKEMDHYVVCSDGLHGYVSENEITRIVYDDKDVKSRTLDLVNLALLKGGFDNITVVLIDR